jgi:hypothetical protein
MNLKGIDRKGGTGLPHLPTEIDMIAFGGGADHVVYPDSTLKITTVDQRSKLSEWVQAGGRRSSYFEAITIKAELCALDVPTVFEEKTIPMHELYERPV